MLDLDMIDVEEVASALADQTDYEHRWLIHPRTGEVVFWTSDTGIDGENPVDLDELDLILIDPLPSWVWYQDMVDFADGVSDRAAGHYESHWRPIPMDLGLALPPHVRNRTIGVRAGGGGRMGSAELVQRRARAVELVSAGHSYDEVAEVLGYASRSGAWKAVQAALRAHQAKTVEDYRELGLQRLDALLSTVWADAMHGDLKAVAAARRIVDAQSRLLGYF